MIHILRNELNHPIGWQLKPTNDEEQKIAATIRDLQFFGFNETNIEYDGITLIDEDKGKSLGNLKTVTWKQSKYITK